MRLLYVAVLGLLAAARAAPVHDCERLTEQLEIQDREEVRHGCIFPHIPWKVACGG